MPLASLHYYLLLTLSGIVLLMQTAVKTHHHQPGSYHDDRSTLHAPLASLSLEKAEFFVDAIPFLLLEVTVRCFAAIQTLVPIPMELAARHDPTPSRAPPS